jgi:hypothetical protein
MVEFLVGLVGLLVGKTGLEAQGMLCLSRWCNCFVYYRQEVADM